MRRDLGLTRKQAVNCSDNIPSIVDVILRPMLTKIKRNPVGFIILGSLAHICVGCFGGNTLELDRQFKGRRDCENVVNSMKEWLEDENGQAIGPASCCNP